MDLKPKFDNETIKMTSPVKKDITKSKILEDPKKIIPNGIYKVIRWELNLQIINILFSLFILLASFIIIILYAFVYKNAWATFIIPIFFFLVSIYKFYTSILEYKRLNNEITKYREDLKLNLVSQPPFITRIYRDTFIRQVKHNWVTFFLIFHGGIFTLLLWWLKDVSWWILEFKKWINQLFSNPNVMVIIFSIGLISIFTIHIFFAIQRKKKILDIETFMGTTLISYNEINELKSKLNKAYRRFFIIYIMILLIIPFLIKIFLKIFKK